jgi:hypothetical protein
MRGVPRSGSVARRQHTGRRQNVGKKVGRDGRAPDRLLAWWLFSVHQDRLW